MRLLGEHEKKANGILSGSSSVEIGKLLCKALGRLHVRYCM